MTQQNNVTKDLEAIFAKARASYVCELLTSPHDDTFCAIAIFARYEIPKAQVITQSDLTDIQFAHLLKSFARIGVATIPINSTADLEAVHASQKPTATFTTFANYEHLVASRAGIERLSADNTNEVICMGLVNVTSEYLSQNSFNLITALRHYTPNARLRSQPKGP